MWEGCVCGRGGCVGGGVGEWDVCLEFWKQALYSAVQAELVRIYAEFQISKKNALKELEEEWKMGMCVSVSVGV